MYQWDGVHAAWLDPEQMKLVFDYCFDQCSLPEATEAEGLIRRSDAASELLARIEASLLPLSYVPTESCPDYLVDITVRRLCQAAEQEVYFEQAEPEVIQVRFPWHGLRKAIVAAAACIAVAAGAFFLTSLSPVSHPNTWQMPQQNIAHSFDVSGRNGNSLRPVYVVDENGSPARPVGMPRWTSGDDPCYPYLLPGFGPQMTLPSPWKVPESGVPHYRVQPMPVTAPAPQK